MPSRIKNPDRHTVRFITFNITPEDILSEDSYIEKMILVRHRIIGVFEKSVDPITKKGITGNYLVGIGPKVSALNNFLFSKISFRGILSREDLPLEYKYYSLGLREAIFHRVIKVMIERQVSILRDECALWWLETSGGIWEIAQSLVDEKQLSSSAIIGTMQKPKYRDERTFHGRPSQQGRKRVSLLRQAPGLSTGS